MTLSPAAMAAGLAAAPPIRVVNYHATPARRADEYDRELAALAERFAAVREDDLADFFATGRWRASRPGVIVALYNGCRDNADVFRPLLDRHGLVGWFFVVTGFAGCPPAGQAAFAARHGIAVATRPADSRLAMDWDELRELDRDHVVASHTRTHARIAADDAHLLSEIVGAQDDLRGALGHPVRGFAGLSGSPYGASSVADALLDQAGYEFVFSNLRVQRLPRRGRPT